MPNKQQTDEREAKRINCKIPWQLWKDANIRAMDEDVDFQDIVTRALEAYLQSTSKQRKE